MSELEALLARLKSPAIETSPEHGRASASALGSLPSSPFAGLNSTRPNMSGTHQQSDLGAPDRTANLLNLLKFNQTPSRQNSQSAIPAVGQTSDAQSTQSLGASGDAQQSVHDGQPSTDGRGSSRPPTDSPQDMLLNLLKRSESTTPGQRRAGEKPGGQEARISNGTTPTGGIKTFTESQDDKAQISQPRQPASKGGMFAYINPFDQLSSSTGQQLPSHSRANSAKLPSKSSSPAPATLPDGRSQLEALMGIGSKKADHRPVAQAVEDVTEKADQDAHEALESAEVQRAADEMADELAAADPETLKEAVHDAAVEIQEELQDGKNKSELERALSKPVMEALQETVDAVAKGGVLDNWESAEAEDEPDPDDEHTVQVYNLPMRPFVSLEIHGNASKPAKVRGDVVMKIATLKKDFDQIDRTLASASPNFIVYAMAKGGGFRVIRQDDGSNRTNFRGAENAIFNVSISHLPRLKIQNEAVETVLATGTNGDIYWTSIPTAQDDSLESIDLDKRGFIMPPLPSTDENTSTSQLKTRVKKSSRHPEFFAYGRGKNIYLVYPMVAGSSAFADPSSRVVDTQKYLSQRLLKIATGKAGKDFIFSEDDTVVVSLDKHGRLKFWDITDHLALVNETLPSRPINMESKVPAMTLWLASSNTKAWPTSVQFVDKDRPTAKGIASRYLLVGLKQNHTLQLWDLGLGKAVQEINLPHANETDAICSIAYHAKSGIIIVGHPTRNSLYFIHLSAPKYNVPSMSQASFLHGMVNKEPRIPRPESTAIMSGIREISLEPIGKMRSVDILASSAQTAGKDEKDDETVFEVYVMHSRGVTCLALKKQDFGWGKDGKVVNGRDAEAEGVVTVAELQVSTPTETGQGEESKPSETPTKTVLKPGGKLQVNKDNDLAPAEAQEPPLTPKASSTAGKAEKKKFDKKKAEEPAATPVKPPSYADALSRASAVPVRHPGVHPSSVSANGIVDPKPTTTETPVPAVGDGANGTRISDFINVLSDQMKELFGRMDEQRRISDVANDTRLETVLRLVSATLTENVEKTLHRIVASNINDKVIPSIADVTSATLEAKVPNSVSHQVAQSVPGALKASMPDAIAKSLQTPGVLQTISEHVASKLTPHIEKHFNANFKSSILPAFTKTATDAAHSTTTEVERRVLEQLRQVQGQHQRDQTKLDQLTSTNAELVSTITDMAAMQTALHKELASLRVETHEMREEFRAATAIRPTEQVGGAEESRVKVERQRNLELETIAQAIADDRPEEATIRWLQSPNQSTIFNELFATLDPAALIPQLNPIVNLSVAAAVSSMLDEDRLEEKLGYLESVIKMVDPADEQIVAYAPRMMDVLKDRVGDEFMRVAEERPTERVLLTRLRSLARSVETFRGVLARA